MSIQEERLIAALKELLQEARDKVVTGDGAVKIKFHRGGVVGKRKELIEEIR